MYCRKCGAGIEEGQRFCRNCGCESKINEKNSGVLNERGTLGTTYNQPATIYEKPVKNTGRTVGIIGAVVIFLLIMAFGVFMLINVFFNGSDNKEEKKEIKEVEVVNEITVPDVKYLSSERALDKLLKSGFKAEVEEIEIESQDSGIVVKQHPVAGSKLEKGKTVTMYVNKYEKPVETKKSNTLYCIASSHVSLRDSASRSGNDITKIYTGDEVAFIEVSGEFFKVEYKGKIGYVLAEFFSDDPNAPLNYGTGFKEFYAYCRASEFVTLRESPSRSAAEICKIVTDEKVKCIGDYGEFIKVEYNGDVGYALTKFFSTDPYSKLIYDEK